MYPRGANAVEARRARGKEPPGRKAKSIIKAGSLINFP